MQDGEESKRERERMDDDDDDGLVWGCGCSSSLETDFSSSLFPILTLCARTVQYPYIFSLYNFSTLATRIRAGCAAHPFIHLLAHSASSPSYPLLPLCPLGCRVEWPCLWPFTVHDGGSSCCYCPTRPSSLGDSSTVVQGKREHRHRYPITIVPPDVRL